MIPGEELIFCALGGSGEIGMNVNLYGCRGQWIMVDLGLTFADPSYPGVELILPDLEFPAPPPNIFLVDEPRSLVLTGQVETLSASDTRSGTKSLKDIGAQREEAETRRLFYVAVTRAKNEVVFVAGAPQKRGFYKY